MISLSSKRQYETVAAPSMPPRTKQCNGDDPPFAIALQRRPHVHRLHLYIVLASARRSMAPALTARSWRIVAVVSARSLDIPAARLRSVSAVMTRGTVLAFHNDFVVVFVVAVDEEGEQLERGGQLWGFGIDVD